MENIPGADPVVALRGSGKGQGSMCKPLKERCRDLGKGICSPAFKITRFCHTCHLPRELRGVRGRYQGNRRCWGARSAVVERSLSLSNGRPCAVSRPNDEAISGQVAVTFQ